MSATFPAFTESISPESPEILAQVHKKHSYCSVTTTNFREFKSCGQHADYSARLLLSNGRELKLDLCSGHLRNAFQIGNLYASRMFPGENVKVVTTSLYQLQPSELLKAS